MSVFTAGASGLGFVKSASSSSWDGSGAMQGAYGSGSPRIGAMFFPNLGGVNWADQAVSMIQLTLTFGSAGRSAGKTVGLYRGTKTGLWGTGSAMLGAYLGDVWSGTPAYNSTKTITFSADSNPAAFAGLTDWLNGGLFALAVYRNESTGSGDSYSDNYLKITGASVSVTYEPLGSKGTLNAETAVPGDTLTLTVEPANLDGTITHAVQWSLGGAASDVQTLPEGVTEASFTVPESWLYQLPDAVSGAASCMLTTYQDGAEKSSRLIPFTVNVPENIVPAFSARAEPSGTSGGYWQHLGGAKLTISDAASFYGATVVSYEITGSEGVSSALAEITTPAFSESGEHVYAFTVTDSRGRTARQTVQIDVNALADPVITAFSVERYDEYVSDSGETVYEANPRGTRVWATIRAAIDPAGGNNVPTAFIETGGGRISVPWTSGAAYETVNDRTLLTAEFSLNSVYEFTLTVSDLHTSVTAFSRVEKGTAIMDVEPDGVAFGGFSTATEGDPKDEFFRRTVFYGGADGLGLNFSETPELTGGTWFDGKPIWRVSKYYPNVAFGGVGNWTQVGVLPLQFMSDQARYKMVDVDMRAKNVTADAYPIFYKLPVWGTNGVIADYVLAVNASGDLLHFRWVGTNSAPFGSKLDVLLTVYYTINE